MNLTELIIRLSQAQAAGNPKNVQIITTAGGRQQILNVGAVFEVKELPSTVLIQTSEVRL